MYIRATIIIFIVFLLNVQGEAQQKENLERIKSRIDHYLNTSVENAYSGSVLVAKDGEILLSKGYGWADREKKILNGPQSIYNIGSVTKQFTAAAILKLQEQDKLKTTDQISKYFPQTPPDKRNISIHQLLTHTTGIPPQTGGFRYNKASKEKFLNDFYQAELMYPPGTKHRYANANYILLAAIIEEVSQQDYESFLKENFWTPLGMYHTGYKNIEMDTAQFAHGFYFNYTFGEWRDWGITQDYLPDNKNHWYSIGKGDIYSSVEDLYTWHLALQQNLVLTKETKTLLETAYVPENDAKTSFYAYGWAIINSEEGSKIVTHNGSNGIYFADFIRYVNDDLVIIVLSNIILNEKSEHIAWEIAAMLKDEHYKPQYIPKNTYELIFDFITSNTADKATEIPEYVMDKTGKPLTDKAILNRVGFKQVSENRDMQWGIALLQLNASLFPEDGNLWDTLGEAYFLINDKERAIESFEKALELRPKENCHWCDNSSKRLMELHK